MFTDCLPSTGSDALPLALGGFALLVIGVAIVVVLRRRGHRGATAAALLAVLLASGLVAGLGGAPTPARASDSCSPSDGAAPPMSPHTSTPTATATAPATAEPTPTTAPSAVPTGQPSPTSAPTTVPTTVPTAVPTDTPTGVPTAVPTDIPTTVPTALPTDVPTTGPGTSVSRVPFVVRDAPPGARVVTSRIWDGYNNCVQATDPVSEPRKWFPRSAEDFSTIEGSLTFEKINSGSCFFEAARLHFLFEFLVGGVKVDEYEVTVGDTATSAVGLNSTVSVCSGPYNSTTDPDLPHVACEYAGQVRTWLDDDARQSFVFFDGPRSPVVVPPSLPTAVPTSLPTIPAGGVGSGDVAKTRFVVTNAPPGSALVTRRIWDSYNNCIEATSPVDDKRSWRPLGDGASTVITGSVAWEPVSSFSCNFETARLHYSFAFYVGDVMVDEYLVNVSRSDGFASLTVETSGCYGPYNTATTPGIPHVTCATAGTVRTSYDPGGTTLSYAYTR
ncbi:LPXTG-motif cell wall anchor domain-containing protein [Rathayibacter oskolensis]|uniref:LPXTG-motif cell wall anchor domain-containing protein n=1 Tax=Rathayibacter oskolensis TaxID=1891671 RepID=A0A1X7PGA6_9MICO|nr:LPXTG cell wall anchor domain-containing protein [Rathayibacter oskolensis]SMH50546.1 LPXTG-motif cell wall anchor domain-containing protein [Rathayibacter oskolensis]